MYRMLEIASHANIEIEAKTQYIDGIPDDGFNKSVLYGACDQKDLRKKLKHYENIKTNFSNQGQKTKLQKMRSEKGTDKTATVNDTKVQQEKRCFNCDGKGHLNSSCFLREKGNKYFQYSQIGHVAVECDKKDEQKRVNSCSIAISDSRVYKSVMIGNKQVTTLFDTGSDLHLMTATLYCCARARHNAMSRNREQ